MPRVSLKRYRPGPHLRWDLRIPGQSVQVDVKQATPFINPVRRRPPMAMQRIQTDHGSKFGTDPSPGICTTSGSATGPSPGTPRRATG